MRLFFYTILSLVCVVKSMSQTPQPPMRLLEGLDNTCNLEWEAVAGRTYFMQYSSDLMDWDYLPMIDFSDQGETIGIGLSCSSTKYFLRLRYSDQVVVDPEIADFDSDGLSNLHEVSISGTDPFNEDSDGDSVIDGDEVSLYGSDPLTTDSDGDGLPDGEEVIIGSDLTNPDSDGDGYLDGQDRRPTETGATLHITGGSIVANNRDFHPIFPGATHIDEVNVIQVDGSSVYQGETTDSLSSLWGYASQIQEPSEFGQQSPTGMIELIELQSTGDPITAGIYVGFAQVRLDGEASSEQTYTYSYALVEKSTTPIVHRIVDFVFTVQAGQSESDVVEITEESLSGVALNQLSDDSFLVLQPVEITAAFGTGPDIPPAFGDQSSRDVLEAYLTGIQVARQGNVWAVNGRDGQGNDRIWVVEVVTTQIKLNTALSSTNRYVVYDGHSNFGFGPDFLGPGKILRVSNLTNYGVGFTDVPLTFRKLIRNPNNPNDPINFGDPFGNIIIPDNEFAVAPANYMPLPINELRFENMDGVTAGQAFQTQGMGFNTHHYRNQNGSKRLMVNAPSTDLPKHLAYKTFFYNACSSGIDYIENFRHGDFIYTNQSCFVHEGTRVFVQGVIEGNTTEQILPLLNIPDVGGADEGEVVYEFHRF